MIGDKAGGEVVMLPSIRLRCVEVWISVGLHRVYRYILNDLCIMDSALRGTFQKETIA